ncbi:ABC transporter C family member 10 isoform X2 [Medicago truncatula]|uniref:ABC transporter C family member 10 isoform X2 n=1 Tax=Medicago truncatula TaxID=3880 RepID=UPI0019687A2C|nr:ABC transporter C family member 10 isoform X2 [Medicago truncatula]
MFQFFEQSFHSKDMIMLQIFFYHKREGKDKMQDIWNVICGDDDSACSLLQGKPFCFDFEVLMNPSSCINHLLIIFLNLLLLIMLTFVMIQKSLARSIQDQTRVERYSKLQLVSAITNGSLGLLHFFLGIWILEEKLRKNLTVFPHTWWPLQLLHGFTWILVALTISLLPKQLPRTCLRLFTMLIFFVSGILCALSLSFALSSKELSLKIALDVLSFLGVLLLLFCTYKVCKDEDTDKEVDGSLYAPLNSRVLDVDPVRHISLTPFAKAGLLSRMSFWWLNPLMKKGQKKTLEGKDIPKLQESDRAEVCYSLFIEQLNRKKQKDPSSRSSVLWTIVFCHRREILISGFFAFLKVLTLSSCPIILNAFILVAEGNQSFKFEGYFLAISLLFIKILESLSQRQWYFRSRVIGMKVRSLLIASIYKKQLKLSNAARLIHSSGEIMNYVNVDAYRIGEFPFWFHQTWTTVLQLSIALVILFRAIGLATIASLVVIFLTVLLNAPLAKLQHKYLSKLLVAQDERLKASSEALVNMKVLKLYAWEMHFKNSIEILRIVEEKLLSSVLLQKAYSLMLFWFSPTLVSAATFLACYLLKVPLHANNVFTFITTVRLVQDPISTIGDVIGVIIQAKVAFSRVVKFLEAPELQTTSVRKSYNDEKLKGSILIKSADFSWEYNILMATIRNINLTVRAGQKIAICGEVGSGKSTLLAAILGEVPNTKGKIEVYGKFAYVSQTAWIQTGTIQENVLFGSPLDTQRYEESLHRSSLMKDLELFPYGDLTEIGERGVNLSGGQKQRIQLARALYQNADVYLLDDPFSAVDAHTAKNLFNEYILEGLSEKTVVFVTHQVDFLPSFDSILLMSGGKIQQASTYHDLLIFSQEFKDLVNAHKNIGNPNHLLDVTSTPIHSKSSREIKQYSIEKSSNAKYGDQFIEQEEREKGDAGWKPYLQYLNQKSGYIYFFVGSLSYVIFVICQISQNSWMAANVDDPQVSTLQLITVYLLIGVSSTVFIIIRALPAAALGIQSSKVLFRQLMNSLFHAPMSFYDTTPLGRILSRVSLDLSIVDLDISFNLSYYIASNITYYSGLIVLTSVAWQVLFVCIPMAYVIIRLQRHYYACAKELMRMNGTTKSAVANHVAETTAGAMTIRAFEEEDRFFNKNLDLIDVNASAFFHSFSSNEWLIQRVETAYAIVLASAAFSIAMLPLDTLSSGFIVSVERINQYSHIPSEAQEVSEGNHPPINWPDVGKVEIKDLKIQYRPNAPLVLHGINCIFEGGHKIGIVGRTGSGKSTLIGALFRLVEPVGGKIIVDGIDISSIGLHDLRTSFGIIPQDPTLFFGTVRYNMDPLSQHSDQEIWEVLRKCQLRESVKDKGGLDSSVVEDGSNWSIGQRQLFCLGRALLRRNRILVLDEATASIDNATDLILQNTIRKEFADCTVITVAHRIPTVMDCNMVLSISDGKLAEYDEPMKLMKKEKSLFGQLVKEYWSHFQ